MSSRAAQQGIHTEGRTRVGRELARLVQALDLREHRRLGGRLNVAMGRSVR